jgi:hypothetical protein
VTTAETIVGRVEARNERGIRVEGEWRNVSRFKPLELPSVGAEVELGLDPKGFINTLKVLDQAPVVANAPTAAPSASMARLEVLKAAANFLGQLSQTREEVRSEHVLTLADKWLAWVEEP